MDFFRGMVATGAEHAGPARSWQLKALALQRLAMDGRKNHWRPPARNVIL
jgi:hypothetical protein